MYRKPGTRLKMAMEEKYDTALLGILQHEGKIETFLNAVFGFLYRRTDYYRLMKEKHDKLGFPPGVALKMLTAVFKQYDNLARRDDEIRLAKTQESETRKKKDSENGTSQASKQGTATNSVQPPLSNTKTNTTANRDTTQVKPQVTKSVPDSAEQKMDVLESQPGASADKSVDSVNAGVDSSKAGVGDSPGVSDSVATNSRNEARGDKKDDKPGKKEEEEEDPELARQQKEFQANADSYNGAVRDNYSWSQSITDVDMKVKVPAHVRKGKECQVAITRRHVKVAHRDDQGAWQVVVDGDLVWDVDKEESMWSLNPGQNIHINFEKKEERWWEAVLTDEPKISVRKIDASRPMADLDDEAQAKIEEMMYNDRQKKMGKPQSHEQKMYDQLKMAWDAEGSPFKGQPFDPSKLNVDPSGVINMNPN